MSAFETDRSFAIAGLAWEFVLVGPYGMYSDGLPLFAAQAVYAMNFIAASLLGDPLGTTR